MRFLKTFVLHLYVDTDVPERVCGDIHPLDETCTYSFKDLRDFAAILLQLANKPHSDKTPPSIDRRRDAG